MTSLQLEDLHGDVIVTKDIGLSRLESGQTI